MQIRSVINSPVINSQAIHKNSLNTATQTEETTQTKEESKNSGVAGYGHVIGRGVIGRDHYPVDPKDTPELDNWQKIILKAAKENGLDPFETRFWVMKRDILLQTAARSGFPVRYRHWSFGQAYQEELLPQKHGLRNLYELVINNNPCYAYLLEENPLYAQKVVMAHVMGHSDFFKNNYLFSSTHRQMLNRMGDHAGSIQNILDTKKVNYEEMEQFIDKVHSIQWLIDMTSTSPRKLNLSSINDREAEKLPEDWGKVDIPGLPSHIEKRINDPERINAEREAEEKRRENILRKVPSQPESDVLAFLIENSQGLKPWQRQVLILLREESYYFAPQLQTKIMNEGWASFWHTRLMKHPDILDLENATNIGRMFGSVMALPKFGINPYALGYEIFKDIEERWNKGQHGSKWDFVTKMDERRNYDTGEMKGLEKVFEVRKNYNDVEFIRSFFTQDVANRLKMYTWTASDDGEPGDDIVISSKDFEAIKTMILEMLGNGGQPLIQVVDANYGNRGELYLEHKYSYELKQDYAEMTLENIKSLWGKPVHLDTGKIVGENTIKPMRISINDTWGAMGQKKNLIKRYILKANKEIDYECNADGKPINSGKPSGGYMYAGL